MCPLAFLAMLRETARQSALKGSQREAAMRVQLNILAIRALRPRPKQYDVSVEGYRGLYLRVHKTGSKRFMLRYGAAGKKVFLLTAPNDLAGVSREYADLRVQVLAGIHPREERRAKREAIAKAEAAEREAQARAEAADKARITFAELAERYLADRASKKRTVAEDERRFRASLLPQFGSMKADEVTRPHVRELLEIIAQRAPIESNRTLALIRHVFAFAVERDIVPANPCAGIKPLGVEKARDRALLSAEELRTFWRLTDPASGKLPPHACAALRFLLMTGARSNEVCALPWSEIDLDAGTWILPAERSKNGRAHLVPLTASMLDVLRARPQGPRPVFWTDTAMLEPRALAKLLRTALPSVEIEPFTVHDLRRTVESHLAAAGVLAEVRDRVLNHAPVGTAARHYNLHDYLPEKRLALETWERRLHSLVTGHVAGVTEIRRA